MKGSVSRFSPVLNLVASYDGELEDVGFTINAFASVPLSWVEEVAPFPFNEKVCDRDSLTFVQVFYILCRSQVHLQVRPREEIPFTPHS